MRVFISYSHKDEDLKNELEIQLAALKRQNLIDIWNDRRITAGKEFEHEIDENLEKADIILLLVSSYFIASDYCYDIEMSRAIERHKNRDARVIPIILHPCDWHELPFGKLKALPTDGKPISKFSNYHDAFLEISQGIRQVVNEISPDNNTIIEKDDVQALEKKQPRSSNLRVKKTFSDHDRDRFRHNTFEYISNYFENSLRELIERNANIDTDFRRIDANHFTSVIYIDGKEQNRCTIWLESDKHSLGGIAYTTGETLRDNSYNESLTIHDNGYNLFLKPMGMAFHLGNIENQELTQEGAAEFYWMIFIEPLQR